MLYCHLPWYKYLRTNHIGKQSKQIVWPRVWLSRKSVPRIVSGHRWRHSQALINIHVKIMPLYYTVPVHTSCPGLSHALCVLRLDWCRWLALRNLSRESCFFLYFFLKKFKMAAKKSAWMDIHNWMSADRILQMLYFSSKWSHKPWLSPHYNLQLLMCSNFSCWWLNYNIVIHLTSVKWPCRNLS